MSRSSGHRRKACSALPPVAEQVIRIEISLAEGGAKRGAIRIGGRYLARADLRLSVSTALDELLTAKAMKVSMIAKTTMK